MPLKPREIEQQRTMDIPRSRKRRVPAYVLLAIGAIVLCAVAAYSLNVLTRPAGDGPIVDRSTIVTDTARAGTLVRSVSAHGTYKPDVVRISSATQSGVVDEIMVKPGSVVYPGSVIARMENPALEAAVVSVSSQLAVAQANLASVRQQARLQHLTQQTVLSDAQAQEQVNALQAKALQGLHHDGLVADVQYQQAQIQAKKSTNDVDLSRSQLKVSAADADAKIAAAQAQVAQTAALYAADQAQVTALTVRAATAGIVQSVEVDPGTSVAQNTPIARIADTRSLKVVLQVAESEVRPVVLGMKALIDTGNGTSAGHVARIAPLAQNGTVAVDVVMSRVAAGARPDASVDGTIEISRIKNAISIARPVRASDGSTQDVFKVVDGGRRAVRTRVRFGQGSNDRVQVLSGVAAGDVVIVSDMSSYFDQRALRLR